MAFKNLKLDIWNTDFRVIISINMINKIKQKILVKGGPIKLHESTFITPTIYYRLLNGKGIKINNYQQIIDFLNINKQEAEKEIIGLTYRGSKSIYPYIKEFSPLLFRIICHIIGDGSLASKNTARYIQHKSNSEWFKNLIKNEIGLLPKISNCSGSKNCDLITIPAYFARLAKYLLNLDIKLIKSPESIKKFLELPVEYRLQFLSAFIVDEGYIRYKKGRSCIISQNNKQFLEAVSDILDSLDYKHSAIKEEHSKKGFIIYRLNIYSQGVLQFHKDINKLIEKYGIYAGLWHKQNSLDEYVKTMNKDLKYTKIEKDLMNNIILDIIKKEKRVSYNQLRNHLILKEKLKLRSKRYLINKFYEMAKQGIITRIKPGQFEIQKL